MKTTKIKIDGMTCANCVAHVEKALEAVPAVTDASVSIGEANVTHDGATDEQLLRALRAAGDYRGNILPANEAK
jgi:copper chaperone CopZ